MLLWDLFTRALDLRAHYGPDGVFPLGLADLTLHSVGEWGLRGLFVIHFTLALCLLVGVRTRVACIGCWLLTWSLQCRSPALNFGADSVLILMLLWGCFLPWGRFWSVDSRRTSPAEVTWQGGLIGVVWLGQASTIYLFTALSKSGSHWWGGADALPYSLANCELQTSAGRLLLGWIVAAPWLGSLGTWLALAAEFMIPILLWTRWRNLGAGLIIALHLALTLLLDLGIFPWICIAQGLSLLNSEFWGERWKPESGEPVGSVPSWLGWTASLLFGISFLVGLWTIVAPESVPRTLRRGLASLRLTQSWGMFAPDPPSNHGWYSARGTLFDGTTVELLLEGREAWEPRQPDRLTRAVGGVRWSNVCSVLYVLREPRWAPSFAAYLRHRWQAAHPLQLVEKVELVYFEQPITWGADSSAEFEPTVIYRREWTLPDVRRSESSTE